MEYSTTLEMNKQATCLDMDALNRKANPESALFTEILEHRKIPHKYIYFFRVEVVSCICNVLSLSPSFLPSVLLKQEKKKKYEAHMESQSICNRTVGPHLSVVLVMSLILKSKACFHDF